MHKVLVVSSVLALDLSAADIEAAGAPNHESSAPALVPITESPSVRREGIQAAPGPLAAAIEYEIARTTLEVPRVLPLQQQSAVAQRSWRSRHPALLGALVGAGAGALVAYGVAAGGGLGYAGLWAPVGAGIGAGAGAMVGFVASH